MTKQEILQCLNASYCDVKALIEEPNWNQLRQSENGHEIQSHMEDVMHYLLELMGAIEEVSQ